MVKLLVMSFDSCGFLFYHLHYCGGCQYVKKQILIAVCVVELLNLVVYNQISLFVNYSFVL